MNRRKKLLTILSLIFLFSLLFTTVAFATNGNPPKAGWLETQISKLVRAIGYFIEFLFFGEESGRNIDALVYNKGANRAVGILDGGGSHLESMRDFIMEFYLAFRYIAVILFIPMGMYIAVYFTRAGDNAQAKAKLKDKMFKLFGTIVLLTSMPSIITILFQINYAFVDVFYSIGQDVVSSPQSTVGTSEGGFLIESFKQQAEDTGRIVTSVAYLIATILNVWMLFYYFIRDITMAFLFVLFPIIAIFFPYQDKIVVTWFKEMSANIFTQAIHSAILTFVVAMSLMLPSTFANLCFIITGFAFVIPMTGVVKRFLGLEGSIGGASTMAGVGMMLGAIQMGRIAGSSIKRNAGSFMEGRRELKDLNRQENELKKNMGSGYDKEQQLSPTGGAKSLSLEDIKSKKAQARKKMLKGGAGVLGGSYVGAITTLGGTAFGMRSAMMLGAGGTMIGAKAGNVAGGTGANAINEGAYQMDKYNSLYNEEGSYEENLAKMTGTQSPALDRVEIEADTLANKARKLIGKDPKKVSMRSQIQKAEMKRRRLKALGLPEQAQNSYAKLMPKQANHEELENLKEAKLYQDKDMSVLYSENERGEKSIHSFGVGDSSLETGVTRDVSFNNGDLSLDPVRERELHEEATNRAFDVTRKDRSIPIKDAEKDPLWKSARNKEFARLQSKELEIMEKARASVGAKGLTFKSGATNVHQGNNLLSEKEVQQFSNQYHCQLDQADMKNMSFLEDEVADGFGAMVKSKNGTTMVRFAQDENGQFKPDMAKVVALGGENPSLGTKSREVSPIKFSNGQIFVGDKQIALEGNTFSKDISQPFPAEKMTGAVNMNPNGVNPNDEIIVTVNNGNYDYFNNTTNEMIATSPVPQQYQNDDYNGVTYHVQVDSTGQNYSQYHRGEQMSAHDWHSIAHSNVSKNFELEGRKHAMQIVQSQIQNLQEMANLDLGLGREGNITGVKIS